MGKILLSIVVPTKNRAGCLKSLIDIFSDQQETDIELVIQDNSDIKNDIAEYIKSRKDNRIQYYYISKPMPVIENSSLAIEHSSGKYVCFMGDDDLYSNKIYELVKRMDNENIECCSFRTSTYSWPGVYYKVHKFPNLIINNFQKKLKKYQPKNERIKTLNYGAVELGHLPQLYHGIVLRNCLEEIKERTGNYFPGPSPDMAIAVALSYIVRTMVYTDIPVITSGKSPKSAAGLGARHEHTGILKEMTFLPRDIEEKWNRKIPFIWTGPTIYAQSAYQSVKSLSVEDWDKSFNYDYFYAFFSVFCREYSKELREAINNNSNFNPIKYHIYRSRIIIMRIHRYLSNIVLVNLKIGGKLYDNISTSYEAEKIIDSVIESISFDTIDIKN